MHSSQDASDIVVDRYKNVFPSFFEHLHYRVLPFQFLAGVIGFYFDLSTDVGVAITYISSNRNYFAACVSILIFHVVLQCVFDYITSMKGRRDKEWGGFAKKCAMNVFHVRIIKEAGEGFRNWKADRSKATPRTAPASFDQVKLIEGVFEGLPQAILQTYLAVQDIMNGIGKCDGEAEQSCRSTSTYQREFTDTDEDRTECLDADTGQPYNRTFIVQVEREFAAQLGNVTANDFLAANLPNCVPEFPACSDISSLSDDGITDKLPGGTSPCRLTPYGLVLAHQQ